MSKKVLFIDRDGTIIREPEDYQIDRFEKLSFLPKVISSLSRIANELDYELVMVSNQDGLGTSSFPYDTFYPVQNFIIETLAKEGVVFADVFIDSSFEFENKPTRKPGTAMLGKYLYGDYDLRNSYVIGDRLTDIQLAKNLNARSIFIGDDMAAGADWTTNDWSQIYAFLKETPRTAKVQRKTMETDIALSLNLDGNGTYRVDTGLPFFDHMLEQLAKHAGLDLNLKVKGDLHIDEHHTIEDTALALGAAFRQALGNKKGIERYGFSLPMDDCLSRVAIDFSGRPWLVWDVVFRREQVGNVPTEMWSHFFKSFSDSAGCNLNVNAEGDNEHHKIESIFKAFARTLKQAVKKSDTNDLPSTKGVL